jgi:hypothetical protein
MDFQSAMSRLYEEMKCTDIPLKPDFQYKLERRGAKIFPLENKTDWEGLKHEVTKDRSTKKANDLSINIIVSDSVSKKIKINRCTNKLHCITVYEGSKKPTCKRAGWRSKGKH